MYTIDEQAPAVFATLTADSNDAERPDAVRCQVFDQTSELMLFGALSRVYLHVLSWAPNGELRQAYDNR